MLLSRLELGTSGGHGKGFVGISDRLTLLSLKGGNCTVRRLQTGHKHGTCANRSSQLAQCRRLGGDCNEEPWSMACMCVYQSCAGRGDLG